MDGAIVSSNPQITGPMVAPAKETFRVRQPSIGGKLGLPGHWSQLRCLNSVSGRGGFRVRLLKAVLIAGAGVHRL